jgi:NAD+ kinase
VKRIGFAYNPTQQAALELRERGISWCVANGIEAWSAPSEQVPDSPDESTATNAIVVLGGDGTFLRAARAVADLDIPLLGVNLGKVGFLSKAEAGDLEDVLELLKEADFAIEPRLMLEARVFHADGQMEGDVYIALNEAAVVRGQHAKVMRVMVDVGDSRMVTWICDGVVIATPTGSTGYSFSAGGPIIEPTSRNLVITPIAAYLTPLRSSVVGTQHVVSATIQAAYDCLVSIDGRLDIPLQVGDRVEVCAREKPISFIQPRGALRFWDLLRQKAELLPD